MNFSSTLLPVLTLTLIGLSACSNQPGQTSKQEAPHFAVPELLPRAGGLSDGEFKKVQAKYETLKKQIAEAPAKPDPYVTMAQLFLNEARVTGKHHDYIPKARLVLDEALKYDPSNFGANITKASMLMTLHQFADAKALAEKAIQSNPASAFAYGVLCDANVELGKYDEAVKASDMMLSTRPDLSSYARASYLREIYGDRPGAISAMKMAADAGAPGTEERSWALYNLANLFLNQGKLDTAAFIYNGILEERPNYPYALNGLASVKAARKDYGDGIELLVKASQLAPEHLFFEQLSDIYLAMDQKDQAGTMEKRVLDAFEQHEKGGWNVDREYAIYCANHDIKLPEALMRAKRELDRRPDNIDVQDTYAWCLYKNGKAAEAVPYIEQAMRFKSDNPILHYHAGMIYTAAGNKGKASSELRAALKDNPYMNVLYADEARKALDSMRKI